MEVIVGKVVSGRGVGRVMGFPTLNIAYEGEQSGVFAGRLKIGESLYLAAVNVGGRPTFDDETLLCEAFVLNCSDDFEVEDGSEIEVTLLKKVRETKKFHDMESLALQISKDVEQIKSWYNNGDIAL